jgi:hypothetical protein
LPYSAAQEGTLTEGETPAPPTFLPSPSLVQMPPEQPLIATATPTVYVDEIFAQLLYEGQITEGGSFGAPPPNPSANLIQNGTFDLGMQHWGAFGDPTTPTHTIENPSGTNPFLQFGRVLNSSGAILQNTAQSVLAGHALRLSFKIANPSPGRKRVTVILHREDFTDQQACVFWIERYQNTLQTYSMDTYTPTAWDKTTVSIYDSSAFIMASIQIDDVVLQNLGQTAARETICTDPYVPTATIGTYSGNLLTNGQFNTPITPNCTQPCWAITDMTHQITNSVLEFRRSGGGQQLHQSTGTTQNASLEFHAAHLDHIASTRVELDRFTLLQLLARSEHAAQAVCHARLDRT